VVALAVLIVTQVWLAGRTRRVLNLPLVTATAAVLVVGLILVGLMAWSQSKANKTRSNAYFATVELATARIDAFDAKSAESLTLIARGSGGAYDANYNELAANAKVILKDAADRGGTNEQAAQQAFTKYQAVHDKIRALDKNGDWDRAVAVATGTSSEDANAVFKTFNDASATALDQRSTQLRNDLGTARAPLAPFAWIVLIVGVAAAAASIRGISLRLREYR
jgi:hypothetical protein